MSGFRGVMASDILTSGADLNDDGQCVQALLATGWRATHVVEWLSDAMDLARAMSVAQPRETILRDMAHEGDAPPVATGNIVLSPPDLPGASASGFFGSGL